MNNKINAMKRNAYGVRDERFFTHCITAVSLEMSDKKTCTLHHQYYLIGRNIILKSYEVILINIT